MTTAAQPRRWRRARLIAVVAGVLLVSPILLAAIFARGFAERR
nr:hypothetical protein [uncultured Sphingomonas sp.]